jgi:hypothetical protein
MQPYSIGVVGGREFNDWALTERVLNKAIDRISPDKDIFIVSGGARGADSLAERYADKYQLKKKIFLPDYDKYKKAAPFIRNGTIVEYSDCLIAFWDGNSRGTYDTIKKAKTKGIPVLIVRY